MSESPRAWRPFVAPGIGWVFAVIALVLAVLILLDIIGGSAKIVQLEVGLLALALLL